MNTETKIVFVYWNLHRECWSVKALDGPCKGKVIARKSFLALKNVTPKVSEAGRQRVIREKKKNVHAGLVGERVEHIFGSARELRAVLNNQEKLRYNPYKYRTFVYGNDESPTELTKACGAMFLPSGEVVGWGLV